MCPVADAGYYKNMPGGSNLKAEVLFSAIATTRHDAGSTAVELDLKAALRWEHRPDRMYGPWADPGGPWIKKIDDPSGGATRVRC